MFSGEKKVRRCDSQRECLVRILDSSAVRKTGFNGFMPNKRWTSFTAVNEAHTVCVVRMHRD